METEAPAEILDATRRALCKHGYADLTMQRIADESSMTTAALHYHYETKQELLNVFLNHLIDQFESRLACESSDPRERLETFLEAIFRPAETDDGDFPVALLELKAQAPFQESYRERLTALDEQMRDVVANTVREGSEAGYFDDADPTTVARGVVTAINGGHTRAVALGEDPAVTRRLIEDYLEQRLGWQPKVTT